MGRRLRQAENEQGLERERNRISKDLHDDAGSILAKILFLSSSLPRTSDEAKHVAERIADTTSETVKMMDEFVWNVNP